MIDKIFASLMKVLILVVMEDSLGQAINAELAQSNCVLILVVMEDSLGPSTHNMLRGSFQKS